MTRDSSTLLDALELLLTPLGSYPMSAGSVPQNACSDGLIFWITFEGLNKLVRL
jgi:hypothetical protein